MTLNPPHITMAARPRFTSAREKSHRLRTVGLSYVPSAGVRVTKLSELSPKPVAQSTKLRIASSNAFPIVVRTALSMSPAHFVGSRLLSQSSGFGTGISGSRGCTSSPGSGGGTEDAGAAAGPEGGEEVIDERREAAEEFQPASASAS